MVIVKGEQNHRKTIDANGTRGKKHHIASFPQNDHCSPLLKYQNSFTVYIISIKDIIKENFIYKIIQRFS